MAKWSLGEVASLLNGRLVNGNAKEMITRVTDDINTAGPGALLVFFRMPDNMKAFLQRAASKNVTAVVIEKDIVDSQGVPVVVTSLATSSYYKLAKAWRDQSNVYVVGVTGTAGKTTTKNFIAGVLSQRGSVRKTPENYNDFYGLALTLLGITKNHEFAALELGTRSPGGIAKLGRIARPNIGVITNIGVGHAQYLGGPEGVLKEKESLLDFIPTDGSLILNADDEGCRRLNLKRCNGKILWGGISNEANLPLTAWAENIETLNIGTRFLMCTKNGSISVVISRYGKAYVNDALLASIVGLELGIPLSEISKGLESTMPAPGRFVITPYPYNYFLIDDTYNANPSSVHNALETCAQISNGSQKVAVLGTMAELGDVTNKEHRLIGELAASLDYKVIALGASCNDIEEGVKKQGGQAIFSSKSWDTAKLTEHILNNLPNGGYILIKASHNLHLNVLVSDVGCRLIKLTKFVSPLKKINPTSKFGPRIHPITKTLSLHTGIDLLASKGTPIYAVNDGIVSLITSRDLVRGNYLQIVHDGGLITTYAHADTIYVAKDQVVAKGQVVAAVGNTGRSTGPHLHFEVLSNGIYVDPYPYLKGC